MNHPFSNIPNDECMCCGEKFGESSPQSHMDKELCKKCFDDVEDFSDSHAQGIS